MIVNILLHTINLCLFAGKYNWKKNNAFWASFFYCGSSKFDFSLRVVCVNRFNILRFCASPAVRSGNEPEWSRLPWFSRKFLLFELSGNMTKACSFVSCTLVKCLHPVGHSRTEFFRQASPKNLTSLFLLNLLIDTIIENLMNLSSVSGSTNRI